MSDTSSVTLLELAAQDTVEAATSALLWAGQDSYVVLTHVAGLEPTAMVETRRGYDSCYALRNDFPAAEQPGFDRDLRNLVSSGGFEPAALPSDVAPQWANNVQAAISEAYNEDRQITFQSDDPAVRYHALRVYIRLQALTTCSLWSQNPLPLNNIRTTAQVVDDRTSLLLSAKY